MDPKLFLGLASLFLGLTVLLWLALGGGSATRRGIMANLRRDLEQAAVSGGRQRQRTSPLQEVIQRQMPPILTKQMTTLWTGAGRPEKWPVERLLATKFLLGLVGVAAVVFALLANRTPTGILMAVLVALLLFFLPELRLYSIGIERRQAIKLQLPDILDQMSIAVNAGLGFDAAMVRVAKTGRGELPEELTRTMQDMQVGQDRRAAYDDLARRSGVESLQRFTRSVIQAEAYGIALSDVLQTQADELRLARRQDAERRAMQVPVKVVFPLILFIMPAMFIVVIGPGVIQILASFGMIGG